MKKRKFNLKVLEKGRLSKNEISGIYGGDSCQFNCPEAKYEVACFIYTECNGTLPDGNPAYMNCKTGTTVDLMGCSLNYVLKKEETPVKFSQLPIFYK